MKKYNAARATREYLSRADICLQSSDVNKLEEGITRLCRRAYKAGQEEAQNRVIWSSASDTRNRKP